MEHLFAIVTGVLIALAGSVPIVWALERGPKSDGHVTIARGLISVLISFIVSSALLLAAFTLLADDFPACGIAFAGALVVTWAIEGVRAYRINS